MKKRIKCYIYIRVSTVMQVDGCSLDAQKEKLRRYAEFQEMEIVGEYCDQGFSGKNIRVQTMAGREQKAREGKWNGGFAPYGYQLVNGELLINEEEAEVIRVIYNRYIHTNDGSKLIAEYLNAHGYTKITRQNGMMSTFSI